MEKAADMPGLHLVSAETSLNYEPDSYTLIRRGEVDIGAGECEESGTSGAIESNVVYVDDLAPSSHPVSEAASNAESDAADSVKGKGLLEGDQEADSFDPKYTDRIVGLEVGGGKIPPVSYFISERSLAANSKQDLGVSAAAISGPIGDYETAEPPFPVATTAVDAETASPKKLIWQAEDVTNWPTNDNSVYLQSVSDSGYLETEENQAHLDQNFYEGFKGTDVPEASNMIDVKCHKNVVESHLRDSADQQTLVPGVEGNSLDLVQLAMVLQGLSEDDFKYLIKLRELPDHGNLAVPKTEVVALPETFLEQHYLANISKDIFHLQLQDQHKQQNDRGLAEVPALTALLADVQECNKRLCVKLDQCRSELEVAISEKLNFQNMCHSAKDESVELPPRVDELKIKLEDTITCFSSVSAELANCIVSLEASEVESERLLKSLASVSEQHYKFEEVIQHTKENQELSLEMDDTNTQLTAWSKKLPT
ncbi:Electron transfer flavoprotein-ubiquinone oxidoreductase mitochondrial [Bienertia sinuspersici]